MGAGLALAVVLLALRLGTATPNATASAGTTVRVTRGDLVVSITETGEIEAERRKVISNELRWPVIIKQVVSEGTLIKKGQVIIHFECKELADAVSQQKLTVTTSKNNYTQARENLKLKKKEMTNKVHKAEQAVIDAEQDQHRYKKGDWPVKLNEAKSDIRIARRSLTLARDKLDFKKRVNRELKEHSPYSANEIKADQLGVDQLQLALEKAQTKLKIMQQYDHPRELRKLGTKVEQTKLDRERAKLEANTQLLTAEADTHAKKLRLDLQSRKLDDMLEQEAKLTVKAKKEGLVVYRTGGNRWRPSNVNIEVGEKINPRQQLMIIPDMSSLQIKTKVYEAMIDQVKPGLTAAIRLDAKADQALSGRVTKVAVLPDSQHRWLNPGVKIFNVTVKLDRLIPGLKPGMTAQVELILARLSKVLSVPVAAVFTEQEQTFCYRLSRGKAARTPVKVGRMNDKRVEIISGLKAGDKVFLAPPPESGGGNESSNSKVLPL